MRLLLAITLWYALMSAVTYIAFAIDKGRAERGEWRIPERVLHSLEALGGWPGALYALDALRHKRQKTSYTMVLYGISALHALGGLWWCLH